jgi:hypothetical protein
VTTGDEQRTVRKEGMTGTEDVVRGRSAVLKVFATGSHSVGLFPLSKEGQKRIFPVASKCAWAAMNGHV